MGSDKGTGLGLAIVHSIIKEHEGFAGFDSRVGEGTTFNFYLPASSKVPVVAEEKTQSSVRAGNAKVLILEDDKQVCCYLPKLLNKLGYNVVVAMEGAEAIRLYNEAMFNKTPFDAVLVDLVMRGGIGGKEVMAELLKADPNIKRLYQAGLLMTLPWSSMRSTALREHLTSPIRLTA